MTGVLTQVADLVGPDTHRDREELHTPVTLAVHLDPVGYQTRPHLQVMANELVALEAGTFDRLLLNTAPQTGKTRTATEWGSFWWLCRHPTARALAGALEKLRDPAIRLPLGRASRERAVRDYSWRAHCEALDRAIQRLLA